MALWLLGIPPVSARTRKFSLCCRIEVSVTLAPWQIVQATIGASKYFNGGPRPYRNCAERASALIFNASRRVFAAARNLLPRSWAATRPAGGAAASAAGGEVLLWAPRQALEEWSCLCRQAPV